MFASPNVPSPLYADTLPPVLRAQREQVFFLSVEAYPDLGSGDLDQDDAALVHCYIDAESLQAAELCMISILQEHGWRPHRLEGWELIAPAAADWAIDAVHALSQFDLVKAALEVGQAIVFFHTDDARFASPDADSGASEREA